MAVSIEYPHRFAGHCASGAFRDLFDFRGYRHRGEPLSEAMIFGLGAGLDFMFMPAPTARIPFYVGGRAPMLEESLLVRVGGSIVRRSEPDDDAAWAWVREKLDRGEPVAMVADCQKLEYLKTRTSMPLHVIVATGYDDTHALIADNDRDVIQRCSHASLREARRARGFPLPAMNVTFEVDWPGVLPPIEALVRSAVREVVAWMRAPHGAPAAIFGVETFGLAAIDRFEACLRDWGASPPREAPAILWIAIEKGGTGGGLFRRLFRDFLAEARAIDHAFAAAHAHYARLADEWTSIGAQCGTGSLGDAVPRMLTLLEREREGVRLLEQLGA